MNTIEAIEKLEEVRRTIQTIFDQFSPEAESTYGFDIAEEAKIRLVNLKVETEGVQWDLIDLFEQV
jgi:hypothetical protein